MKVILTQDEIFDAIKEGILIDINIEKEQIQNMKVEDNMAGVLQISFDLVTRSPGG